MFNLTLYTSLIVLNSCCLDTQDWVKKYPACGGTQQSPINIETSVVEKRFHSPITFDKRPWPKLKIQNDGNGIKLTLAASGPAFTITNGPMLNKKYEFLGLHFHWGENDKVGAENQIDGEMLFLYIYLIQSHHFGK